MNKTPRLGIALIVSGPSGAGKSTVCNGLREQKKDLYFSVSCATRKPRPGEKNGKDYYFVGKKEFESKIRNSEFLEYAEVHGNYYGTLRCEVMDKIKSGRDVLLDIDVQGAMQIKNTAKNDPLLSRCAEFVFISPPDFKELERRLRSRGTESEEVIQGRLKDAKIELDFWKEYDFLLVNGDIEKTITDLRNLLDVLHKSTKRL